MVDVLKLLEYNDCVRNAFFEKLEKMSWEEFALNREASFNSIRNIFVHILEVSDYWLDFLLKQKLRSQKRFDEYRTFADVASYKSRVEKRMRAYLDSLGAGGLSKAYSAKDEDGKTHEVTAEDVLIHIFEEEVYHKGELIALLWQIGIEPPATGWKGL